MNASGEMTPGVVRCAPPFWRAPLLWRFVGLDRGAHEERQSAAAAQDLAEAVAARDQWASITGCLKHHKSELS